MHFPKINFPIKVFNIYLLEEGNFIEINVDIILHIHFNIYGIAVILSIKDCNKLSIWVFMNKKLFFNLLTFSSCFSLIFSPSNIDISFKLLNK